MRGTKKIDWLNHFLEFIVVVIGILLAFQLNTCREDKKEVALIEQHIANIIEESHFNDGRVDHSIKVTKETISTTKAILKELNGANDVNIISLLVYELLRFEPSYFKTTAYSSLKESGDIRFMKKFKLRDRIITLYEYYDWASGLDEASSDTYSTYLYPFVMKNMDMSSGLAQDPQIFQSIEFKNSVTAYQYILQARLGQNSETKKKIGDFLTEFGN